MNGILKDATNTTSRFEVGVFPMINAVLFPGVTLPLHIFEKRFGEILDDIQQRKILLAVSLVVPNNKQEFALSTICGTGTVKDFKRHRDGHADILILGQKRVRLCSIIQTNPYFIMEAETIEADMAFAGGGSRMSFEEFRALVKAWIFLNPEVPASLSLAFDVFNNYGDLTDFFVFHFMRRPQDQQEYLNCTNAELRAEKLTQFLEKDLMKLGKKAARDHIFRVLH